MILIAGGYNDPNIQWLLNRMLERKIAILPLLTKADSSPRVTWDLQGCEFRINGDVAKVSAAFVRNDVFHKNGEHGHVRASAWYSSIQGWLTTFDAVRTLNRGYLMKYTNKPQVLLIAKEVGFDIPNTWISNDQKTIKKTDAYVKVAKPVNGGGFCQEVTDLLDKLQIRNGSAACPAIVQEKISGPDIRIYRVGSQYVGFKIETESLDYRATRNHNITLLNKIPYSITSKLEKLMNRLGMDWGAADLKLSNADGQYYFLEVNSNPMFSVFDKVGKGILAESILDFLLIKSTKKNLTLCN